MRIKEKRGSKPKGPDSLVDCQCLSTPGASAGRQIAEQFVEAPYSPPERNERSGASSFAYQRENISREMSQKVL